MGMTERIVYLGGGYVPEAEASVPVMDRGLLFADAVYEGFGVLDGQIVDYPHHWHRLIRSLGELAIPAPFDVDSLWSILMELIERNDCDEAFLYLHVTRGVAVRDYVHGGDLEPTVFAFTLPPYGRAADPTPPVCSLATAPDWRWARRDIKTPNLLAQVLAKQAAHEAGADEALLLHGEEITEAGSSSFFIVSGDAIVTRPLSTVILPGVTRRAVIDVAASAGMQLVERPVMLDEALVAREAFLTASSSYVEAVGSIDGHRIGDGRAGPVTTEIRKAYLAYVRAGFVAPPIG